jgi:hypothetical protein
MSTTRIAVSLIASGYPVIEWLYRPRSDPSSAHCRSRLPQQHHIRLSISLTKTCHWFVLLVADLRVG